MATNTNKLLSINVYTQNTLQRATARTLSLNVVATATMQTMIASDTEVSSITYDGTAPIGLGSQQGSLFTITVAGTFSDFSITLNGKTISYSNTLAARIVIIDNVNGTATTSSVNSMAYLSGDIDDFFGLINGANAVTLTRIGTGIITFKFDYNELYY